MLKVKRALLSVSDKGGIVDFARRISSAGTEIISTGGTANLLKENDVPVIPVSRVTGFPEILDGRVKTLHPKIHGGILARRDLGRHREQLAEHRITPIDMVVVNLYPFEKTVANPEVSLEEAVENIDIGGPTMIRSAAKNYRDVVVVVDPDDYSSIAERLETTGDLPLRLRYQLMVKTFKHTAAYDTAISNYFAAL